MTLRTERPQSEPTVASTTTADIVERLRDEFVKVLNEARCNSPRVVGNVELSNRIVEALQKRIAELETDAERYRWLRDSPDGAVSIAIPADPETIGNFWPAGDLDAAIDAAMKD